MALTFGVAATGVAQAQDNGAFAFEVSGDLIPDTSPANPQGRVFKFNIPAGKRLVIERMTMLIVVEHSTPQLGNPIIGIPELSRSTNGQGVGSFLPRPALQYSVGGFDTYLMFIAPGMYADGPAPAEISMVIANSKALPSSFGGTFLVSISGHLVCPQSPACLPSVAPPTNFSAAPSTSDASVVAQSRPRFAKPTS